MTETQFKEILKKLDNIFRPVQVGSNENEWLAVGKLVDGISTKDLDIILKKEPCQFSIKKKNEQVYIRISESEERVILRIPKIPRIHLALFLLTIFPLSFSNTLLHLNDHHSHTNKTNLSPAIQIGLT